MAQTQCPWTMLFTDNFPVQALMAWLFLNVVFPRSVAPPDVDDSSHLSSTSHKFTLAIKSISYCGQQKQREKATDSPSFFTLTYKDKSGW